MDTYLPSLKKRINEGKIDAAKKLLSQISSKSEIEKQEILQLLALAPDKTAYDLLSFLTDKAHKDPDIYERLIQLIIDRAHLNFDFSMILIDTADHQTIVHAAPLLSHILSTEIRKTLLSRIIRTAGKIKIERLTDDIAEFMFYDDADLKAEAVKALERIGTSRALKKLIQASKTAKSDQNILDTIDVLTAEDPGNTPPPARPAPDTDMCEDELETLSSPDILKRFKAVTTCSEKGPGRVHDLVKYLGKRGPERQKDSRDDQSSDLTINILHLIARTIPAGAVNDIFDILKQNKISPVTKFAAYNALASYPKLESAASIVQGLSDSALFVRLAAVRALDKNLSDFVCAEIKTTIESGTKKGETLAQTILDARAVHIIDYLMMSDTFSYMASNYLEKSASIQVLDTFIDILEKRNLKSTARKYMDLRKIKSARNREHCIIISASEAVLCTYNKLIYACGYAGLTFQNPQEAFEAFMFQRPCAIICDLFLDNMTGMDLAREAREIYPKKDVPIILSTVQKHLDKSLLQKELENAGVTEIWDFPATSSQIKAWRKP